MSIVVSPDFSAEFAQINANIDAKISEAKAHITAKSTSVKNLVASENDATQTTLASIGTRGELDANTINVNGHTTAEADRVLTTLGTESYPVYICKNQGSYGYHRISADYVNYTSQNLNVWPAFIGGAFLHTSGQLKYEIANVTGSGFVSVIRLRKSLVGAIAIHITVDGKKSTLNIENQVHYGMLFLNWIEPNSASNSNLRPIWRLQADLGFRAGIPFKSSLVVEIDYSNAGITSYGTTYDDHSYVQYSLDNTPLSSVEVATI